MSEDKLPFVWSACLIIYNVALIQLKQTPKDTFYPNVYPNILKVTTKFVVNNIDGFYFLNISILHLTFTHSKHLFSF